MRDSISLWCWCILWGLFFCVIVYGVAPIVIVDWYVRIIWFSCTHSVVSVAHFVEVTIHLFDAFQVSHSWRCIETTHCGYCWMDINPSKCDTPLKCSYHGLAGIVIFHQFPTVLYRPALDDRLVLVVIGSFVVALCWMSICILLHYAKNQRILECSNIYIMRLELK